MPPVTPIVPFNFGFASPYVPAHQRQQGPQLPPQPGPFQQLAGVGLQGASVGVARGVGNRVAEALGGGASQVAAPNVVSATRPLTTAANVSTPNVLGASRVPGTQAASATGGLGSVLTPALGAAGVIGGGYGLARDFGERTPVSGALSGASIGGGAALLGAPLGPVGIGLAALGGGLLGSIKTGKHEDQKKRDKFRDRLQEIGVAFKPEGSGSHHIKTAEGVDFDIGLDGGYQDERGDALYNLDFNNETTGKTIGLLNPLMMALSGGDEKSTSDFVGYFTNAIEQTGGDPLANARKFYDDAGLDQLGAYEALDELRANDKISSNEHAAFLNGVNTVFGGELSAEDRVRRKNINDPFNVSGVDVPVRFEIAEYLKGG
jgi:hypothetical protein